MDEIMLRVEKKLDEILAILTQHVNTTLTSGSLPVTPQPMQAAHQICPLCKSPVEYVANHADSTAGRHTVYYRRCRCVSPTIVFEEKQP